MKKTDNLTVILLFAAFLLALGIGGWILEDRSYSENENRVLQQLPAMTVESLLSGDFEEDFQRYQDDQIPFRDDWIAFKTAVKLAMLNRDINGTYLGKDGYLIEKMTEEEADRGLYGTNLKAISDFCSGLPENITKSVIIVPTTAFIMKEKLPMGAAPFDETSFAREAKSCLKNVNYVDLYDAFRMRKTAQLYYKTDHHWTTEGAAAAYDAWRRSLGDDSFSLKTLKRTVLADDFQGTLYSKVIWDDGTRDTVTAYTNRVQKNCRVTADGQPLQGIYQSRFLQSKDKYAAFFGGNYGKVEIDTGRETGKNLLIIKDSFANCFAPFAAEDYGKVCMVDLRYFSGNLQGYMDENQITDVLLLYSMADMVKDKNISVLKNKGDVLS